MEPTAIPHTPSTPDPVPGYARYAPVAEPTPTGYAPSREYRTRHRVAGSFLDG
jgi:hypothetical protein